MYARGLLAFTFLLAICGIADAKTLKIKVKANSNGTNVPIKVVVDVADTKAAVSMTSSSGTTVPGQLLRRVDGKVELVWVAPQVKVGTDEGWTATIGGQVTKTYSFVDTPKDHLDLNLDGKPVLRYMYARDTSTEKRAHETYKVYHHVMNEKGDDTITKGPYGKYTHHRGIFLGYKTVGYDKGKKNDWWHMKGVTMEHRGFIELDEGPVAGRSILLIHWLDGTGKPVIEEKRVITAYKQSGNTMLLLDFEANLTPVRSDVDFNGDPEHAGCQYRPRDEVDKKATKYFFHDDSVTTKNVKQKRDLPWFAEQYTLKDHIYSVQHITHPDNPKGTRHSVYRDYGRFGSFPAMKVKKGETGVLRFRYWVGSGKMAPREQLAAQAAAYRTPPTATIE